MMQNFTSKLYQELSVVIASLAEPPNKLLPF
jgi:hypothetical protein